VMQDMSTIDPKTPGLGNPSSTGGTIVMTDRVSASNQSYSAEIYRMFSDSKGFLFDSETGNVAFTQGTFTSDGSGRVRLRFTKNPSAEVSRILRQSGAVNLSEPSGISEEVRILETKKESAIEQVDKVLEAASNQAPKVEVGDIEEETCDKAADSSDCRIQPVAALR